MNVQKFTAISTFIFHLRNCSLKNWWSILPIRFKTILFLGLVFGSQQLRGQEIDFKKLELPNVSLHALQLGFSGNYLTRNQYSTMNLPLNTIAFGYVNNRFKQTFYNGALDFSYFRERSPGIGQRALKPGISFSLNRYLYTPKYYFIHGGLDLGIWHERNSDYNAVSNTTIHILEGLSDVQLGIGKGRVDPIDWAIRAGFMNKSLRKSGGITRNLSDDELLMLAKTIAVVDNSRFFDQRFFNIRRMKQLDSLLDKFNVKGDALAFYTTLSDQYFFAPSRIVYKGSRLELIGHYLNYSGQAKQHEVWTNNQVIDSTAIVNSNGYKVGLNYAYHLPVNLYWHHRWSAELYYQNGYSNIGRSDYRFPHANGYSTQTLFSLDYALMWFPSTRTSLTWNVKGLFRPIKQLSNANLSSGVTLQYFVSRQLKYTVGISNQVFLQQNQVRTAREMGILMGFSYQPW